eukprot:144364-Rhodomonas_salina.2
MPLVAPQSVRSHDFPALTCPLASLRRSPATTTSCTTVSQCARPTLRCKATSSRSSSRRDRARRASVASVATCHEVR